MWKFCRFHYFAYSLSHLLVNYSVIGWRDTDGVWLVYSGAWHPGKTVPV